MKFFKEIITRLDFSKSIQFENEYFERFTIYKQTSGGRSFVVDFELKILPTRNKHISVYYIEDQQTKICIDYIFKGFEKFIELKNTQGVAINPFDIIISNAVIHPVDFNAGRYVDFTCKRLNEISFEIGKKKVLYTYEAIIFNENSNEKIALVDKKFPSVSLSNYNILLPNRKLQKLMLPLKYSCDKELIIEKLHHTPESISILIKEGDHGFRHINKIMVLFEQNINGINSFISLIDGIKKFADDVYRNDYDIGGFTVFIFEANITSHRPDFSEQIYWFLKELVISKNEIEYL